MKNPYKQVTEEGLYTDRRFECQADNPLRIGQATLSHVGGNSRSELISCYPYLESTTKFKKVSNKGISFYGFFSTFDRLISTLRLEYGCYYLIPQWVKNRYTLFTRSRSEDIEIYFTGRYLMRELPEDFKKHLTCPCECLASLIKHAFSFVFFFNRQFTLLYANRLPSGHPSEFIGNDIFLRIHPADRARMRQSINEAWKNGHVVLLRTKNIEDQDMEGKFVPVSKSLGMTIVRPLVRHEFTNREREIRLLISEGLTSKEIADKLHVSKLTVETHRKNIRRKA